MTASGKQLPDFSGSLSSGSAEEFDHNCDPCLTAGLHIDSHGFCLDCQEYLCKNCFTYHQRTKASRDHQLLDRDSIDKHGIPKTHGGCSEKCHVHKDEVIKFFCCQHEKLGCHDCIALHHRSCSLEYIPDKCAGFVDSEEYRSTSWLLNEKMKEVNNVVMKATSRGKEIDTLHEDLIEDIEKFEKEISAHIQQLRKEIQIEVDTKKSSDKQIVQDVLDTCTTISSDISKLQSSLQVNNTTKQNGPLYIAIKQAMSKLKSDEIKKSEEELEKTSLQFKFEHNPDIQKLFSKPEIFGKLRLSTALVTPEKKLTERMLIHKDDINIETKSDKYVCYISGCANIASNKLVLVDSNNSKLKVLNTESKIVVDEKKLDSRPYDITAVPDDKIAVTVPDKGNILIMTLENKLSTVHTFSVKGQCRGITYHQDHLYVVCKSPTNIVILDTKGDTHHTISLKDEIFKDPHCIVVNGDSRLIYISDPRSNCIGSITLQGQIAVVYKCLLELCGMLMLDDSSLLVCCWNGSVHHITGNLKQHKEVIHGLQDPFSICYNPHQKEVYIDNSSCNQLKVFSLR